MLFFRKALCDQSDGSMAESGRSSLFESTRLTVTLYMLPVELINACYTTS